MLEHEIKERGDVSILRFYGSIGVGDAHRIKDSLAQLPRENSRLVINLGVSFVTSEAIGNLIFLYKRYREKGGQVVLCNITPSVRQVLEITRLDKLLPIVETEEEAVTKLSRE
ncbi:anti-sigma factor antagonist [Heliomicrobium modesticaldum Ice1]|uniref:Anti-sigma factor antagonist n=1 Tax=Heliobacterium modesticaldum (strain ATCC 51547 / Ice1) TaxID=498761 RepID=B0TC95_HELMI|nr:STAS domain-containing protein [Heliomicrobium modesticaldum]ABZ83994.1 anti-sigma factor antagonist [Heliomicrobium modesticaldum Ice1]